MYTHLTTAIIIEKNIWILEGFRRDIGKGGGRKGKQKSFNYVLLILKIIMREVIFEKIIRDNEVKHLINEKNLSVVIRKNNSSNCSLTLHYVPTLK